MKIALRASRAQARSLTYPGLIRLARNLGVDGIELTDDPDLSSADVRDLRADVERANLAVACYDVMCGVSPPAPQRRRSLLAPLRDSIERASELGAKHVLFVPSSPRPGAQPVSERQRFVEEIRTCLADLQPKGLRATIGNHGAQAAVFGTSDVMRELCHTLAPHVSLTYDVGNWLLAGENPLRALQRVAPFVVHVHVKDWHLLGPETARHRRLRGVLLGLAKFARGGIVFRPAMGVASMMRVNRRRLEVVGMDGNRYLGAVLGEGIVDLGAILAGLQAIGYSEVLSIEYEGDREPQLAFERGVSELRHQLGRLS